MHRVRWIIAQSTQTFWYRGQGLHIYHTDHVSHHLSCLVLTQVITSDVDHIKTLEPGKWPPFCKQHIQFNEIVVIGPAGWTDNELIHLIVYVIQLWFNSLRPRQNGCHFPNDILKCTFSNENLWILINFSLKLVPMGQINNIPALVHIMALRWPVDKPWCKPWGLVYRHIYALLGLNELKMSTV